MAPRTSKLPTVGWLIIQLGSLEVVYGYPGCIQTHAVIIMLSIQNINNREYPVFYISKHP